MALHFVAQALLFRTYEEAKALEARVPGFAYGAQQTPFLYQTSDGKIVPGSDYWGMFIDTSLDWIADDQYTSHDVFLAYVDAFVRSEPYTYMAQFEPSLPLIAGELEPGYPVYYDRPQKFMVNVFIPD